MDQKPSVGRIVHVADEKGSTCAAVIVTVHNDECINVQRFDHDGKITHVTSLNKVHYPPKGTLDWNWPARV